MSDTPFSSEYEWRFLPHFVIRSPGLSFALLQDFRCFETLRALSQDVSLSPASPEFARVRELFHTETDRARRALLQLVHNLSFQDAIFLSSPDFFENNLGKYLKTAETGRFNSDMRRIERRLFAYLQRFVAKNETTSIFGPLNYGTIANTPEHDKIDLTYTGVGFIQKREVFLAYWAVKALADAISRDERLEDDLPLWLTPWTEIIGSGRIKLHHVDKEVHLPEVLMLILASLDGQSSLQSLASHYGSDEFHAFSHALPTLLKAGVVERGFRVPSTELRLLDRLIVAVADLPASAARREWLTTLEDWRLFCSALAMANLARRRELLKQGEAQFEVQTGLKPRRGQGEMYADRLIFYEEALGNVARFSISSETHDALRHKMRGALELAAAQGLHEWQHLRVLGKKLFLSLSSAGESLPFQTFIAAAQEYFEEFPTPPLSPVHKRLSDLVQKAYDNGAVKTVDIASSDLAIPETKHELYALPDLFLSSASEEDLAAGQFEIFLGKLHHHLLVPGWLTTFHPDCEGLRSELAAVMSRTSFSDLAALEVRRRNKGFYDFPGPRIEYAEPSIGHGQQTFPMYQVKVALDGDGALGLITNEGRRLRLYLTLADHLRYAPFAMFTLPWLAPVPVALGRHTPRISIDGVIIQRERWLLPSAELLETCTKDEFMSFVGLERFRQAHGLPQQVYVKGSDRKPVFVDFSIPQCHVLLNALAQKSTTLLVEEMFPGATGLWLNQQLGGFTCELRMNVFKCKLQPPKEQS